MNKDIAPALDEITAVLKKHDMVGLIIVGNPTHCDWRMQVEASWSCATIERDAAGSERLRVRSKLTDYSSKEAQKRTMEATVGTFVTFHDVLAKAGECLSHVLVTLSKHVKFTGRSTQE